MNDTPSTNSAPHEGMREPSTPAESGLALLADSFEAMDEGILLCEATQTVVLHNTAFEQVLPASVDTSAIDGQRIETLAQLIAATGEWMVTPPADNLVAQLTDLFSGKVSDMALTRHTGLPLHVTARATSLGRVIIKAVEDPERVSVPPTDAHKLEVVSDVVETMDEGVSLWDADLNFVLSNDRYLDISFPDGSQRPQPGQNARDILTNMIDSGHVVLPEDATTKDIVDGIIEWLLAFGPPQDFHFHDGRIIQGRPKKTKFGGCMITLRDVTHEREAARRRLEAVNDAVGALDEGFALIDQDLNFVLCNPRYMDLAYPPGHPGLAVGTPILDALRQLFDPSHIRTDKVTFEVFSQRIIDWVRDLGPPTEYRFSDGRVIRTRVSQTDLGGYLILVSDITQERNSEQKARDMLFEAFQSLDEGLVLCDSEMRFVFGNDAWHRMMFDRPDRIPPKPGDSAIDNLFAQIKSDFYDIPAGMSYEDYAAWMMGEMSQHGKQVPYRSADGRHFIGSSHQTSYGGALMFIRDVTGMHNAEERAHDIMLDAIQSLDEGLALLDRELRFVYANEVWYDMFYRGNTRPEIGAPLHEMMAQGLESGTHNIPEGVSGEVYIQESIDAIKSHARNYSFELSDGRVVMGSSHETRLDGYLTSFRDITDEQRAEEKRLEAVTDALNAADYPMVLFGSDRSFVLANRAWYKMVEPTGLTPEAGENGEEILWRFIQSGYYVLPEGMTNQDLYEAGLEFIYGYEREFPLVTQDGRRYLAASNKTALGGYLLSYRDITEQIQTERALAEQRDIAHQNEKLSALGELLAGVAHELNNPLSVVFGYSQMVQGKVADPVIAERIDLICQSAERAAKIVKTFLAMARQRPTKIETCSINDVVVTALEVSSYSLKANGTEVLTNLDTSAPLIRGDFDQLAQVFSNLVINAGYAVEPQREAGQIIVKTFRDEARNETVVEIRDNGPGIPNDIQKRIFEPFFTTKDVGEGTGVGLAFSHRIVTSHEGRLDLQTALGRGTSFFVRLKTAQSPATLDAVGEATSTSRGPRSVLVLDDEEGVAQLIHDLLVDEGLHVTKTTSPRNALELAQSNVYDVVLSDFKMPDMDGQAFYDAMRVVSPHTAKRIGFVTGDAMGEKVRNFFSVSGRPYIEKPIIKSELMALVDRLRTGAEF